MNRQQYLLIKLAEEATEVAKEALKTAQFGFESTYTGETNRETIHDELNDLHAIIEMLNDEFDFGYFRWRPAIDAKKLKVNKYYEISKELGEAHDD